MVNRVEANWGCALISPDKRPWCLAEDHCLPIGQKRACGRSLDDVPQADFWPASKSAIKCRIRSAVTQAEAAIAIATSLHR